MPRRHETWLRAVWPGNWFSPSGGAYYHLRGWTSQRLWRNTKADLENLLLQRWPQNSGRLVLVGPSGGYLLSSQFLSLYREVIVVDIDPLAPVMFTRQHRDIAVASPLSGAACGTQVQWHSWDFFFSKNGAPEEQAMANIQNKFGEAHYLFWNLFGQLPLHAPIPSRILNCWRQQLTDFHHPWLSLHDLVSVTLRKNWQPALQSLVPLASLRDWCQRSDLSSLPSDFQEWAAAHTKGALLDHGTTEWVPCPRPLGVIPWPLTKTRLHFLLLGSC